jgi:hypothetical protein
MATQLEIQVEGTDRENRAEKKVKWTVSLLEVFENSMLIFIAGV